MTCFLALDTQLVDTLKHFANELRLQGASLVLASPDIERIRNETDLGFDLLALPQSLADYDATTYPIENTVADPFNTWLAEVDANWWNGAHGKNSRRSLEGLPHCTHVARQVMAALRPSIVFAWSSGVYPVSRVWQDVARQMGIPAFCLERGFLPGTWMIDEGGMNAQSDMRSHPLIRRTLTQHTSTVRIEAYRKWYQAARPRKYGAAGEGAQALRAKLGITGRMVVILGSLDCAGLQPRSIAGAEINSPGFSDSRELILAVGHALENEPDLSILFKAHPGEKDNFPQGFIGRVQVIEDVDVIDLIQTADVIVAGLTGLSFETLLNKRPLVLVANSPLQGTGAVFEALTPGKLTNAIHTALLGSTESIQQKSDLFLDSLLTHCLYATDDDVPGLPLSELAMHCAKLGASGTANLGQAALALKSVAPRITQPAQEFAQLFFDTGNGFNEAQSIKKKINRADTHLTFELPTGTTRIQGLRFDPINDCALIKFKATWLLNSHGDSTPLESHPSNASYQEGQISYFDHADPQIIIRIADISLDDISNVYFEFELIAHGRAAEMLSNAKTKKSYLGALQTIISLNGSLTERDGQIFNLNQAVAVRDEQIVNLNQAATERDGQISSLSQAVTERDGQIASLNQVIADRDSQIVNLYQGITDRDSQVVNLYQGIADRDSQIVNLYQGITDRDSQVVNLYQGIADRDSQIVNLYQGIADRDSQIVNYNKTVVERDGQIASLNQSMTERDAYIRTLVGSKSWLITKPIRWVGRVIRGDFVAAMDPIKKALGLSSPAKPSSLTPNDDSLAQACGSFVIPSPIKPTHPVAVILPVYRGIEMTKRCILAAMPGILAVPDARLIAINDASPDVGMQEMLEQLASQWPNIFVLLKNESNLGFVGTVNRGFAYFPQHDAVLLNSDVIVPQDWLRRLIDEAYSRADIGTVTPFSNNATICSFPHFLQENPPPFNLDVDSVDAVFRHAKLPCIVAPTGVGFCMYIRRACLDVIGYLNQEKFGRGYGEENDLCQRALKSGWHNIISPNLYAYHEGGVSFSSDK